MVLAAHRSLISRFGGEQGVRDERLLDSALAQPEASFAGDFLHSDLYEMAAAYLFHIVQNHPFIDGNKRTGYTIMRAFLLINGLDIELTQDELYELTVGVADGRVSKADLSEALRKHST